MFEKLRQVARDLSISLCLYFIMDWKILESISNNDDMLKTYTSCRLAEVRLSGMYPVNLLSDKSLHQKQQYYKKKVCLTT